MKENKAIENRIDPREISFAKEQGVVYCQYKGEKFKFSAMPAFPLTSLHEFIFLYKRNEDASKPVSIGFIENLTEMEESALVLLKSILDQTCLLPQILEIIELKDEFYSFHIYVKTDRGLTDFFIGSPRKHLFRIGEKSLLIHDLQNNYYFIENLEKLENNSFSKLDVII